ncbi:MAG: hypothetical protein MRJ68_14830 [Nitrospira sp.]|nr:hypothetical protein [Nitrospira sp.]
MRTALVMAVTCYITLHLSGCGLTRDPFLQPPSIVTGEGGCSRPAESVGVNPNDLTLTLGKFKDFITLPSIEYKNDPRIVEILQKQDIRALISDYLICVAKARHDIDPKDHEQVDYVRKWAHFMSSDPTSEQISKWAEQHPFPKKRTNASTVIQQHTGPTSPAIANTNGDVTITITNP